MNTQAIEATKYKSPYPSVVTYRSDKNFDVRLKAFVDKKMKDAGYDTNSEQFLKMIADFRDAEDYLFESKTQDASLPTAQPTEVSSGGMFSIIFDF